MQKLEKLDESVPFFQAIGLVVRIQEKKMTMALLKREASEGLIFIMKDKLGWIAAKDEDSEIEITDKAKEHMIEYHAMIILENIKNRAESGNGNKAIRKFDFESKVPKNAINFLKEKGLIVFSETGQKYPDDQVICATEKGIRELEEYFKKEE